MNPSGILRTRLFVQKWNSARRHFCFSNQLRQNASPCLGREQLGEVHFLQLELLPLWVFSLGFVYIWVDLE